MTAPRENAPIDPITVDPAAGARATIELTRQQLAEMTEQAAAVTAALGQAQQDLANLRRDLVEERAERADERLTLLARIADLEGPQVDEPVVVEADGGLVADAEPPTPGRRVEHVVEEIAAAEDTLSG